MHGGDWEDLGGANDMQILQGGGVGRALAHPAPILLARLFLAWILIAASWPKIVCPAAFSVSIAAYRVAPDSIINLLAASIPWIELFVGIGLALGYRTRAFGILTAVMMLGFIAVVGAALLMGVTAESCGCNVPGFSEELGINTLTRDVLFLIMAIYIAVLGGGRWSVDSLIGDKG